MNTRRALFAALALLTTVLACAVPGLPSASQPMPTPDTRLEIIVAETVSAALAQTQQAAPTPTAPPTPTFMPTVSPTPETVLPGSTLAAQEDGSTFFADERAGYEITVPAGWLAVGVNKQEFLDAFSLAPEIQNFLLSIQNRDPNTFRLFAIDTLDGHFQDGFFTNINFIWDEQNTALLRNEDGLKAGIAQLAGAAPEPEILSTTPATTSSGISVVFIESKYTMKNSSTMDIVIFQKQVIFNARTGTIAVTLSTVEGLKDTVFSVFDAMLETVKIVAE